MDILITEAISNNTVNRVLQEILIKSDTDKESDIRVYINSPGGDVESGYALYEMLKLLTRRVCTYAVNEVMSSAITVYLAGEERYATNYSNFMIHAPFHELESEGVSMTTDSYKKNLKELEASTNEYFKMISSNTALTPQKIREYINKTNGEWYFKGVMAKKLGIVTKIGVPFF